MSKFRFFNVKCNSVLFNGIKDIPYTDIQIAYFSDTITHEKCSIELTDKIFDAGQIEVFNEIFPLSAFGI